MQSRIVAALLALMPAITHSQSQPTSQPVGWEVRGIPAINFNADEGFVFGVIPHAFNYGSGGARPFNDTLQPQAFLTTKGRRDVSLFFGAPHLLPGAWRWSGYVGREQHLATPYYGLGNASVRDTTKELAPNLYFYRYGRVGVRFNSDLQHTISGPLRVLVGGGFRTTLIDLTHKRSVG